MLVEATLDFPEEDIDFLKQADAQGQLDRLQQSLARVVAQTKQGALLREGIRVVIAGQPNAGKSSLLNALAGAELAIVTPIAGTTRDVVQQTIQIEGVPLHVVDTAGLREHPDVDEVERIGIARAWDQIGQADAVLFLHDLMRKDDPVYTSADQQIEQNLKDRVALHEVHEHLMLANASLQAQVPALDLLAEELRLSQNALNTITGEFTPDDLLGVIFSSFCIGK